MRRWRALLLGLLLVPANSYWLIYMERVRAGPYVSSISLFPNVIFIFTGLVLLNRLVHRLRPTWAFDPGELLLTYVMLTLGTAAASMDFIQVLMMMLSHARQFATPENGWESFFPHLPSWLLVQDLEAVGRYHRGHSSLWLPQNYRAYLVPCLAWLTLIAALLGVGQGTNALLARPWIERERLTFPVLDLPVAMVTQPPSFFRRSAFLIGMLIPMVWGLMNGLHFLYPAVPEIPIRPFDLVQGAASRPIRAMRWMPVTFYPFCIGLGYLLPLDLLFSCWFFYLFWKAEAGLTAMLAWDVNPAMPYPEEQAFGACLALVGYLLYTSRGYLRELWAGLGGRGASAARRREFRQAAAAVLVSAAYLIFFSRLCGMSWLILALFWAIYAVMSIAITRIRAELGPPVHDFHKVAPDQLLPQLLGTQNILARDLGMLSLYWWFNRAYRSLPQANQMEALKAAQLTAVRPGWFHAATFLGGMVGAASAILAYLYFAFDRGAAAGFHSGFGYSWENFGQLMNGLSHPTGPDWNATGAIGAGLLFSTLLLFLRLRFLGWPFHPIGFALAACWSINILWLPLLIAWVLKSTIVRWGGRKGYLAARPFFLGLILGDCLMGSFWPLLSLLLEKPMYSFWGA